MMLDPFTGEPQSPEYRKPVPWYKRLWYRLFGPSWRPQMVKVEPRSKLSAEAVAVQPMTTSFVGIPVLRYNTAQPSDEPSLDKFLATYKDMAPRLPCCDHHDNPADIDAHLERLRQRYRTDIEPPDGYTVMEFGSFFSGEHMAYTEVTGRWIHFKGATTMTPLYAKSFGPYVSYATKKA